jgi:hypothetical protein
MGKKYALDDNQASRVSRGLKVRVFRVGKLLTYQNFDEWYNAGETENVVVLAEGVSANKQKEVSASDVVEIWHRSKNTVFIESSDYKVRYE